MRSYLAYKLPFRDLKGHYLLAYGATLETATPFGLRAATQLKELWYERGHYASRDSMWELLVMVLLV